MALFKGGLVHHAKGAAPRRPTPAIHGIPTRGLLVGPLVGLLDILHSLVELLVTVHVDLLLALVAPDDPGLSVEDQAVEVGPGKGKRNINNLVLST